MKKLLNPKLNIEGITVIDNSSSDEKLDFGKGDSKGKKPLKTEEESSLTETKLSAVFLEIRDQMLKEQQKDEIEVSYLENKLLIGENVLGETDTQENPSFHDTSIGLLAEDEELFRKLNIPWIPNELQSTTGSKAFDSEKENLQRAINQYKHQVEYMQETNDGLIIANKRLKEDLEEVNNHYQELIAVSKEALKRKRSTDLQFAGLK